MWGIFNFTKKPVCWSLLGVFSLVQLLTGCVSSGGKPLVNNLNDTEIGKESITSTSLVSSNPIDQPKSATSKPPSPSPFVEAAIDSGTVTTAVEPLLTFVACYSDPQRALDDYLIYLHDGRFPEAAVIYAGIYEGGAAFPNQQVYDPDISEAERIKAEARSFSDFCSGYQTCLEHQTLSIEKVSDTEYVFTVNFYLEDGKPFVFDKPAVDTNGNSYIKHEGPDFRLRVKKIHDCYKVLDIPPITP